MKISTYKRNERDSVLRLIIGFLLVSNLYRTNNFLLFYEGILMLIIVLLFILGLWGLFTPIAKLYENELVIQLSIIKKYRFEFIKTTIVLNDNKDSIQFSDTVQNIELKLKLIKPYDRAKFLHDIDQLNN